MKDYQKLILITHRNHTSLSKYLDFVERCVDSGVTAIQLREKNAPSSFLFEFGVKLQEILSPFGIPLIINDNVEIAKKLNADGLHLGQSDGNSKKARLALGQGKIIGVSIEYFAELCQANKSSHIDYVAASAVFPTKNKRNLKKIWGVTGLESFVKRAIHPVIAIGGINLLNLSQVLQTGIRGVAVIGAIHDADNPEKTVQDLRRMIDLYLT